MKTITCIKCHLPNLEDQFHKSSLKKRHYICKSCNYKAGKEHRRRRTDEKDPHVRYLYAKSSAKTCNKPFLLTEIEYVNLISKPCFYCGLEVDGMGIGLDRINNDKTIGYTVDNVLPCCGFCNRLRGHLLTVDEAKVAIKAVLEFRTSQVK